MGFNYHGLMKKQLLWAFCGFWLAAPMSWAQTGVAQTSPSATRTTAISTPTVSALDAELFYRLLVGEITARQIEAARVTAAHKLRIVRAWKAHGAVVAMTARLPARRRADPQPLETRGVPRQRVTIQQTRPSGG